MFSFSVADFSPLIFLSGPAPPPEQICFSAVTELGPQDVRTQQKEEKLAWEALPCSASVDL